MAGEITTSFVVDLDEAADFYFTLEELRETDRALEDTAKYDDGRLIEVRDAVEGALEHREACNVAFVPRVRTVTLSGTGAERLLVPDAYVRRVITATTADDNAVMDVTTVRVVSKRGLWRPETWPLGTANLIVSYEHGYSQPPGRVKQAALILAKNWVLKGPIDDRATQLPDGAGGVINLATPGMFGARFGLPEVDAVVSQYRERTLSVGAE